MLKVELSELQIGDIVNVSFLNGVTKPVRWTKQCFSNRAIVKIEAIEITEDFLLKNGFKLVEGCTSRWYKKVSHKVIYVTKPEGTGSIDITFPVMCHGYRYVIYELPINDIHQLQHVCNLCNISIQWEI